MRIVLLGTNLSLTAGIREHIEHRLASALDRVDRHIDQVRVRVSDINGPRGGADKRCLVEVMPHARAKVILEEVAEDLYVAIDRAISRAKTVVHRRLARKR